MMRKPFSVPTPAPHDLLLYSLYSKSKVVLFPLLLLLLLLLLVRLISTRKVEKSKKCFFPRLELQLRGVLHLFAIRSDYEQTTTLVLHLIMTQLDTTLLKATVQRQPSTVTGGFFKG